MEHIQRTRDRTPGSTSAPRLVFGTSRDCIREQAGHSWRVPFRSPRADSLCILATYTGYAHAWFCSILFVCTASWYEHMSHIHAIRARDISVLCILVVYRGETFNPGKSRHSSVSSVTNRDPNRAVSRACFQVHCDGRIFQARTSLRQKVICDCTVRVRSCKLELWYCFITVSRPVLFHSDLHQSTGL